jgi:hypothetical protein
MKKLMLTGLVLIASWMEDVQALPPQQIVNQAKPSVVAIILSNSTNYRYSEGTGWFISENRIVTNSHVVNAEGFDHYQITNLATGQDYLIDRLQQRRYRHRDCGGEGNQPHPPSTQQFNSYGGNASSNDWQPQRQLWQNHHGHLRGNRLAGNH